MGFFDKLKFWKRDKNEFDLSKDEVKRKSKKPKSTAKTFEDYHKTSSKSKRRR